MSKRIKWSTNFKRYPEREWPYKGLRGAGKAIAHGLLVLCALYAIYAFFHKTELNLAVVKSSAAENRPADVGILDSVGRVSEEDRNQQAEDMG